MQTPTDLPQGCVFATSPFCKVGVDPSVGNLPLLTFQYGDQQLAPLHRAPWVGAPDLPETMPAVDQALSGDFVCAPFGASDVEAAPPHGWSANSAWSVTAQDGHTIAMRLERTIMGASLTKHLRPAGDAPLLYQVHTVEGGSGGLTFAHHPMLRVTGGARLFTSPKRLAVTPDTALVPGRHALACGSVCEEYTAIAAVDGGTIDVSRLPISHGHEDFVALVEAAGKAPGSLPGSALGRTLGWTAVIREAFNDIVFVLKDPRVLPLTMLWHSNGGRKDAPWSGQHCHVLGIEDGIAAGAAGHKAALGQTVFSRAGVATCLPLAEGRVHRIAHVIGAVPRPQGWQEISDITITGDTLSLHAGHGAVITLSFDGAFFEAPMEPSA